MSERTRYAPGTFCWVGLATSDPVAASSFYGSLFGWEGEDLAAGAAGSFTMLRLGGKDVAILYRQMPEARAAGAPPHWTLLHLGRERGRDRGPCERAGRRRGLPRALRRAGRRPRGRDTRSDGGDRVALAAALTAGRHARQRRRRPLLERARDDRPRAGQVILRRTARLGVPDRRERLRLDQELRQPEWRHARADRAGAGHPTELAPVFHRRGRR